MVASPIAMTNEPATLPSTSRWYRINDPSPEAAAPMRVKVAANPETNRVAESIVLDLTSIAVDPSPATPLT
jgi:hypothetical protein